MPPRCYIAGTGLVSVQGLSVEENWRNLYAGRVLHETGRVPIDRDPSIARVSQLAVLAADEAWRSAGRPSLADGRTALVVGTSKGPIDEWLERLDGLRTPDVRLGLAQVAADLADAFGHTRGPRLTLAGACASGLHALIRARDLLATGECDSALVVAAESSLHALFATNFARLGVLADPAVGCKPFDVDRQGFLLAEAAAAVWLTTRPSPTKQVEVGPGRIIADATHLTGTDPSAASLETLLRGLNAQEVDLIHAHGTGTRMNDAAELVAVARVGHRERRRSVYSHKHAIGHTQGAAGLIGVVLNAEMHRRQSVLANANTPRPEPMLSITSNRNYADAAVHPITRSLVVASGFGGTLAAIDVWTVCGSDTVAADIADRSI